MGRPRKILEMQKGDLTKKKRAQRAYEESLIKTGSEEINGIPDELFSDEVAKQEYIRIWNNLDEINIIGNLDRNNILTYANSYSMYVRSVDAMKEPDFEPVIITAKGARPNPWYQIQAQASRTMANTGKLIGIDPSSRLKMAADKAETQEEDLRAVFGDI